MNDTDRVWLVQKPSIESVRAPLRLLDADVVEIRVSLTPLRYFGAPTPMVERQLQPVGDTCYATASVDRYVRVDAKDSRVFFYLMRQLLMLMAQEYLGVEL